MYEGCGDWGEMDYSCLARPKMRPNPVALFYKRLFHKFTTGNECEEKKTRLVRDHISKNPGFLLSSNTQEKGMNTELKRKMVSSQALISTFSLYSVLAPFRQPLGKAGTLPLLRWNVSQRLSRKTKTWIIITTGGGEDDKLRFEKDISKDRETYARIRLDAAKAY